MPVRSCIACRRRGPMADLVRCTLGTDGVATIDRAAPGRGAWVCADSLACFDLAVRARRFDRAWRRPVEPVVLSDLRGLFVALGADMRESTTGDAAALSATAPVKG